MEDNNKEKKDACQEKCKTLSPLIAKQYSDLIASGPAADIDSWSKLFRSIHNELFLCNMRCYEKQSLASHIKIR